MKYWSRPKPRNRRGENSLYSGASGARLFHSEVSRSSRSMREQTIRVMKVKINSHLMCPEQAT